MNPEQLNQIRLWVESYVDGFRPAPAPLPPALALKSDHTRRVAENAREIAQALRWSPEDVHMAEALGWLHDVGRFAQFAEFGHFHDASSVDHGLRGYEIVRDSGVLASLPENRRSGLLDGIRHHNAKTIPATLAPANLPFLKLVRDADKLDIYRVVIDGLTRDGFQDLAGMWPHVDLHGPVSPRLLREIRTQRDVDVAHVQSLADFLVLQAFWVYDLNYAPSRKLVCDRRILESLAAHLPDDPAAREFFDEMQTFLDRDGELDRRSIAQPMPNSLTPFDRHADRYEAWFEKHPAAYASELAAVREFWPAGTDGVEIGVGAGHFAAPLGIATGVEPSATMRQRAEARGIRTVDDVAEHLSFSDGRFGAALMVTTICFVGDAARSLQELHRVLRPGGFAVVAFVDRQSPLGREYERRRNSSAFYRDARFFSTAEVAALLADAGFVALDYRQTLFRHPDAMQTPDPVRTGSGDGSFVVVRGRKPGTASERRHHPFSSEGRTSSPPLEPNP